MAPYLLADETLVPVQLKDGRGKDHYAKICMTARTGCT